MVPNVNSRSRSSISLLSIDVGEERANLNLGQREEKREKNGVSQA